MTIASLYAQRFPLTYGMREGVSGYMTNPSTGIRFTPEEFNNQINMVSKSYDVGPNPYLANETHSYDVQG